MKKSYSNRVLNELNKKKSKLSILLEEDDIFSDDAFGEDEDEDKKDEEGSTSEDLEGDESDGDGGEDSESGESGSDQSEDTESIDAQSLETLKDQITQMKSFFEKLKKNDGTSSVEAHISAAVASGLDDDSLKLLQLSSYLRKSNILGSFLIKEEDEEAIDKVEAEIDDLDRILTKGSEIVDKFKKGSEADIDKYVNAAINAYRNFDSLFAKELIVKQATLNVLILNSGGKAEANIREFEELFHEELHKQFGIEYEEYALITKNHNAAAGAKSQG